MALPFGVVGNIPLPVDTRAHLKGFASAKKNANLPVRKNRQH
jgi:hypothetical protein